MDKSVQSIYRETCSKARFDRFTERTIIKEQAQEQKNERKEIFTEQTIHFELFTHLVPPIPPQLPHFMDTD